MKKQIRIFETNNLPASEKKKDISQNAPKIRINLVNGTSYSVDETDNSTEGVNELSCLPHVELFSFNGITNDDNVNQNYAVFSENKEFEKSESSSSSSSSEKLQNLSDDEIKVKDDITKVKDSDRQTDDNISFRNDVILNEDKQLNLIAFSQKIENKVEIKNDNEKVNDFERLTDDKTKVKNDIIIIGDKELNLSSFSEKSEILNTNEIEVKTDKKKVNDSEILTGSKVYIKSDITTVEDKKSSLNSSSAKSVKPSYNTAKIQNDIIEAKDDQSSCAEKELTEESTGNLIYFNK